MKHCFLVCGIIMIICGHQNTSPKEIGEWRDLLKNDVENDQENDTENDNEYDYDRIRYGEEGEITKFPFMAQIVYVYVSIFRRNIGDFCSGSLISYKHILSAAHCAPKPESYGFFGMSTEGLIYVGSKLRFNQIKKPSSMVKKYFLHPKNAVYSYDIAVFMSDRDLSFIPIVKPISLPDDGKSIYDIAGDFFTAGWGLTEGEKLPDTLRYKKLTMSTSEVCQNNVPRMVQWEENALVCSMKGSACRGDSGGPLFAGNPPSVWAVTSFGISPFCTDSLTYFARADTTLDFIKSSMSD